MTFTHNRNQPSINCNLIWLLFTIVIAENLAVLFSSMSEHSQCDQSRGSMEAKERNTHAHQAADNTSITDHHENKEHESLRAGSGHHHRQSL